MKKGTERERVPNADCKVRNGVTLVLVKWDDTSRGQSHFVPVHCLKTLDKNSHSEEQRCSCGIQKRYGLAKLKFQEKEKQRFLSLEVSLVAG